MKKLRQLHKSKSRRVLLYTFVAVIFIASSIFILKHGKNIQAAFWTQQENGGTWAQRKQLTVTNNSGDSLAATTTVAISVDTRSLFASRQVQGDCDDIRIVYQPNATTFTELSRYVVNASSCATSGATKVNFPLQATLANGSSTTDYYLYYANPQASAPSNPDAAFNIGSKTALLVCPFDGSTTCAAGETPSTETGAIRYSGSKSALSFRNGAAVNMPTSSSSLNISTNNITVEMWVNLNTVPTDQVALLGDVSLSQYDLRLDTTGHPNFRFGKSGGGTCGGSAGTAPIITINAWTHLAATYDGSNLKLYQNGILVNTTSCVAQLINSPTNNVQINWFDPSGNSYLIDEVRISDTVRYTSNFTPSTSPFVRDANTKLLLHFDENGDDPRNTGKAIDDSGNGNHGTITGAKYVAGLVGVDASATNTGYVNHQSYADHEGVFIEEGTTNKITNPSFENSTLFSTNWATSSGVLNYDSSADTFTPVMSKRNSAGPFAAGVALQGKADGTGTSDTLRFTAGNQIAGNFKQNIDTTQGSLVLWVTPEWNGNDNLQHNLFQGSTGLFRLYKSSSNTLIYEYSSSGWKTVVGPSTTTWTAGSTYNIVLSWDSANYISGTNFVRFSVNSTTTFSAGYAAAAPVGTYQYIGTDDSGTGPANAIIEGLTLYRRPLYEATTPSGINVGNGDEISQIYNSGTGKDPTLVTGSWDVVFALPTNASTGALSTGTGNAWSHPHSSNLLYTDATNTGGFMMNGTYTSDGWADEGTPTAVAALATANKIFAGGYYATSDAVNEGISYTKALTASSNYVIRALGNSDGTCNPQVLVTRADGTTEITHLNGTTTSIRTAPDVYIFTFQAPATENGVFKLINTASTGTCSWHQIEILSNIVVNPSVESGAGDPWIPTGWSSSLLVATEANNVAGKTGTNAWHMARIGSGSCCAFIYQSPTLTVNKFYDLGFWYKGDTASRVTNGYSSGLTHQYYATRPDGLWDSLASNKSTWTYFPGVLRAGNTTGRFDFGSYTNVGTLNIDDVGFYTLDDVSLTVTPASEANSGETSGLRVDGADTLTQAITQLAVKSGTIEFKFTPRHNFNIWENFGFSSTKPYVFNTSLAGADNNFISLFKTGTTLLLRGKFGTSTIDASWATPTLNAGTTYTIKATYIAGGSLTLYVDGTQQATVTGVPSAGLTGVPTTIYFGTNWAGDYQIDGTFNTAIVSGPTVTQNTTAPYVKFGTNSVSYIAADPSNYQISINPGNTNTHTLSAYVYHGTSGSVGGTVDGTVASLLWEGAVKTTTYTDMGGGWWRLTYSAATTNSANNYGVYVASGKTVYVDGVQLEEKSFAYATTYADGSLGTGYAWTGTANNSTSTRTDESLIYSTTNNLQYTTGTISFWFKPDFSSGDIHSITYGSKAYIQAGYGGGWGPGFTIQTSAQSGGTIDTNVQAFIHGTGQTVGNTVSLVKGRWYNATFTWGGGTGTMYVNNSGTSGSFTSPSADTTFYVGGRNYYAHYADSQISDLRIYDSALTSTEVGDLYYSGLVSHSEGIIVDRFTNTKGQDAGAIWHMDEGYGTSTYDSSRYGNTGTISGATWQNSDLCVTGKCLKFDGTDDVVTVSNTVSEVSSVGFWVRPTSTTASMLALNASAYISASSGTITATGFTSPTIYVNGIVSSTLTANQWQYIEVTTGTAISASAITIGKANGAYTSGFIDEVKLYPFARSAAQVKVEYSMGSIASTGLVGYWKMDEASGTLADASGNSNTGTWAGTGASHYTAGKFGNGSGFNGTDDYVNVADSSSFTLGPEWSASFWIKPNVLSGYQLPLYQKNTIAFQFNGATLEVAGPGWFSFTSTGVTGSLSTWQHISMSVTSAASNNVSIYKDGILVTTLTKTSSSVNPTLGLDIGAGSNDGISRIRFFNGSIDETRIYNRALSPKEVRDLYNWAPPPSAHWSFEEGQGASAYDISGNGHTGTLSNSPTWASGKYGKGLSFNGVNQAVSFSAITTTSLTTWEAWVKPNNFSSTVNILRSDNTSSYLRLTTAGTIEALVNHATLIDPLSTTSTTIPIGSWSHIAITYDDTGTRKIKIFINGVEASYSAQTAGTGTLSSDLNCIGRRCVNTEGPFNGSIDDVRIYNYARTQKQIVEDMNGGHPAGGSPVGSQVGYWKFDEGQGITANNSGNGGSTLNGTITTATWTNSGKFGKALNFNGTSDNIILASYAGLTGLTDMTVSAWVNLDTQDSESTIISQYDHSPQYSYSYFINASGSPQVFLNSNCDGTGEKQATANGTITTSSWYHIVYVLRGGTDIKFYINGKLDTTSTNVPSSLASCTSQVRIGDKQQGPGDDGNLDGLIDEVKIYNYALTSDEVKLDYNQGVVMSLGAKGTNSSYAAGAENQTYCIPGDASTCSAPVGEWNFDEGSGSAVNDSSGNSNTGTATGTTIVSGKYGKARSFNGSSDYVGMSSGTNYANTQDHTYEAWVKYTSYPGASGYEWILDNGGSSTGTSLILRSPSAGTAAKIAFFYGGGSAVTIANTSLSLNAWYHVSAVYSATTNKVTFYLNGVDDGTSGTLNTWSGGTSVNNVGRWNQSGGMHYFTGSIDQVRIYNYARTPAQIAWDYNRGKPVGWWKMDECTGGTANDSSGNSNSGTISIGASGTQTATGTCQSANTAHAWYNGASGKLNSSLNFDGTDDQVSIPNMSTYSTVSVSSWFKNTGSAKTVISSLNNPCGAQIIYSDTDTFGQLCFSDASWKAVYSGINTLDSQWHHGVTTWDGTYVRFYLDGVLRGTSTATASSLTTAFNSNQKIGSYIGSSSYFGGQIDDVRVYNYALTGTQVKTLFNDGGAVRFGP